MNEKYFTKLDRSTASRWIKNFGVKRKALEQGAVKPIIGETRSLVFEIKDIFEMVVEMEQTGANGMNVYLAEGENITNAAHNLTIQFVFTRGNGGVRTEFTIEDEPDFSTRVFEGGGSPNCSVNPVNKDGNINYHDTKTFNTANPCPPADHCEHDSDPDGLP